MYNNDRAGQTPTDRPRRRRAQLEPPTHGVPLLNKPAVTPGEGSSTWARTLNPFQVGLQGQGVIVLPIAGCVEKCDGLLPRLLS